jgi:glycosyltransferase involved in cell wall biosynthesis
MPDPGSEFKPEPWLSEMLKQPLQDVDFLIQATTCNIEAVPKPGVLNALYTFFELDRIPTHWVEKANQFDFIIVPCQYNGQMLVKCGVVKPIFIIQPPTDLSRYDTFMKPVADPGIPDLAGKTVFYNICQLSGKKGIDALLRAYYAAFADMPDDVVLVLKTYINMGFRGNDLKIVKEFIQRVKQGCHIPLEKLPPVLPVVNVMSEDQIRGLHTKCDAYVNSSRAEGFCLPAFDALGFGKTLISNNFGGMAEYVTKDTALTYGGCISNVYDQQHSEPFLYTGLSRWFEPSTAHMADTMRSFHLLKKGAAEGKLDEESNKIWASCLQQRENGKQLVQRYCLQKNGPHIFELLKQAFDSWKANGKVMLNKQEAKTNE